MNPFAPPNSRPSKPPGKLLFRLAAGAVVAYVVALQIIGVAAALGAFV